MQRNKGIEFQHIDLARQPLGTVPSLATGFPALDAQLPGRGY